MGSKNNSVLFIYKSIIFNNKHSKLRFLDLSCGRRKDVKELVESKGHEWVGIDIIDEQFVIKADAHDLPFPDESFDIVYSGASFEYYHDPFKVGKEVSRVLKPGGFFLGLIPFIQPWHNSYYHFTFWGVENFLKKLEFEILDLKPNDQHALSYLLKKMFPFALGKVLAGLADVLVFLRKKSFLTMIKFLNISPEEKKRKRLYLERDLFIFGSGTIFLSKKVS
jgi:ubiquinone/menaquinone biosynthesis C-methylase UbiE